ncbi:SDR family oxidoreductase [Pontibacter sp. HSC-36F09]|uniref:SDR family oxidoreductase n=1 Tax=Pontibacter sp. HSC-36F09 TaxID=2910966 RepID=UPI0020A0DD2E|nr:SDR family oxidoreductase [Pontibacter sp. HSC-36F09]MCP2043676.1 NAD(P)-dependent dehydrogenase (short-subunit alcohol dehydrogenase family) [Pontibacter sp. HSC-36F09]
MLLKDKVILVTGGSGLLGKAFINNLKEKGAIALNLDVNVKTDFSQDEVFCNITNDASIYKAIDSILDKYHKIDGLVNNAYPRTKDWGAPFEQITTASWRENVDLQLNSYFVITQAVLKEMRQNKAGSIVNIASIYGVVGNDFTIYEDTAINPPAAYSAIKGGLVNFTRYLASLYGKHNVRVNCVSPGGIFDRQPETFVSAYEKKVPMKRMGNPDDIAPAVSFLLSEEAKYITGQNLVVDGGWTAI